jgi:hypothetical protein
VPGLAALGVVWCSVLLIAGCGPGGDQGGRSAAPSPGCQVTVRGFSCPMQERIEAARRYLAQAPGRVGLVLHDRVTGATWRNANARQSFPAASTVKLAMVTDLLIRERRGSVRLTPADRPLIDAALRESADGAADRLWYAYEDAGFLGRIRAFGMTGASFTSHAYWGAMTCSADDLSNLMDYVLNRLPARDRDEIMEDLRQVSPVQHWGVWGAGPRNQPGVKNSRLRRPARPLHPGGHEPSGRGGGLRGGREYPDPGGRHLAPGPPDSGTRRQRHPMRVI